MYKLEREGGNAMAALDPINSAYEKKIQSLTNSMKQFESLIGSELPKGMIALGMMLIIQNLRNLYQLNRENYIVMNQLRNEIVNLSQKSEGAQIDLELRLKETFGSLENGLNQINEEDAKKKDKGDNPFYA
jgi:hypothetical protein